MSTTDLHVDLDGEERTYRPGEAITGRVRRHGGSIGADTELQALLEWHTLGSGDEDAEVVARQSLASGESQGDAVEIYEFSFEAPAGPCTYRGEEVNVEWRVRAVLEGEGGRTEADGEMMLTLEPGETEDYEFGEADEYRSSAERSEESGTVNFFLLGFGLVMAVAPVAAIVLVVRGPKVDLADAVEHIGDLVEASCFGLTVLLFVAAFLYVAYTGVRPALARRKFEAFDVRIAPDKVTPGQAVRCELELTPGADVSLTAEATLTGREESRRGGGRRERRRTHELHESSAWLAGPKFESLRGGVPFDYEVELWVPESAPFSFYAHDNEVAWTVRIQVTVLDGPDLSHEEPIMVQPPASVPASAEGSRDSGEEAPVAEW